MPSFSDSAIIVLLALLLFGPKKLPELARQLGKLMAEFRRASNEFRMQMEDELRVADQAEQQKKLAAIEAAAPKPAAIENTTENFHENTIAPPYGESAESFGESFDDFQPLPAPTPEPLPIATSGDINLMPPATGLPEPRSAIAPVLNSIPHTTDPEESSDHPNEATYHG